MDKRSARRLKPGTQIIFANHGNISVAAQRGMPMCRGRVKLVTQKGGVLVTELAYRYPHHEISEIWVPYHHVVTKD